MLTRSMVPTHKGSWIPVESHWFIFLPNVDKVHIVNAQMLDTRSAPLVHLLICLRKLTVDIKANVDKVHIVNAQILGIGSVTLVQLLGCRQKPSLMRWRPLLIWSIDWWSYFGSDEVSFWGWWWCWLPCGEPQDLLWSLWLPTCLRLWYPWPVHWVGPCSCGDSCAKGPGHGCWPSPCGRLSRGGV